ncbi:MAG: MoxR family ATPase [Nitrospirales bacterium]|nr:MoxR family ATPase [Nitrospirales bacterium]
MSYKPLFDPDEETSLKDTYKIHDLKGDVRDGEVYVYNEEITLAINVALATGRPLLVRGAPGSGKSSLAPNIARKLKWRYYEGVITSRTEARDLLWTFDAVRRLGDAQAGSAKPPVEYIEPGVLWWAFNPESGAFRGRASSERKGVTPLSDPSPRKHDRAVVLLDEIDKADPDVPNNLLVALGSRKFTVLETGRTIGSVQVPLVVITTNNERALPAAFLRRCVVLALPDPDPNRLQTIGKAHIKKGIPVGLFEAAANKFDELKQQARLLQLREPSAAEYLDLLWACKHLNITSTTDSRWRDVSHATLWKHDTPPGPITGPQNSEEDL